MIEFLPKYISALEGLTDGRKQGYFPHIRNGDVIIRVFGQVPERDADGNLIKNIDGTQKMVRKVIYRRDLNVPFWRRNKKDWVEKKYIPSLRNFYGDKAEEITISLKGKEREALILGSELDNMAILESILIHQFSLNQEYSGNKILFTSKG